MLRRGPRHQRRRQAPGLGSSSNSSPPEAVGVRQCRCRCLYHSVSSKESRSSSAQRSLGRLRRTASIRRVRPPHLNARPKPLLLATEPCPSHTNLRTCLSDLQPAGMHECKNQKWWLKTASIEDHRNRKLPTMPGDVQRLTSTPVGSSCNVKVLLPRPGTWNCLITKVHESPTTMLSSCSSASNPKESFGHHVLQYLPPLLGWSLWHPPAPKRRHDAWPLGQMLLAL